MSSNVIRHDNIIPLVTRQSIASRYHTVTKAINQEFWNSTSETPYARSDIRADGQVVKIAFSDGTKFEVLPAFPQTSWGGSVSYKYPDTNTGGNWRTTDPKS